MIRHYYTLVHVVRELSAFIGTKVIECFSQEKDNLIFHLFDGEKSNFLQVSTDSKLSTVFIRKNFNRAGSNSVDLLGNICGNHIRNVRIIENERIIEIELDNYFVLLVMFGGSKSNIVVTDKELTITDSFKNSTVLKGKQFEFSKNDIMAFSAFPQKSKVSDALSKCDMLLGKYYAKEVLNICGIDSNSYIESLKREEIEKILNRSDILKEKCLSSKEYFLYNPNPGEYLMSLIPLSGYGDPIRTFVTANEAIQKRVIDSIRTDRFGKLYQNLNRALVRAKEKIINNLENIRNESATLDRAETYKKWAELIISQPSQKEKPGEKIILNDWEGNQVEIPLDTKLSLIENANKYFEKSKDAKQRIKSRSAMIPQLNSRLYKIAGHIDTLNKIVMLKELERFMAKNKDLDMYVQTQGEKDPESKYRKFDLGEGFILYVGKNASNNDELTMRFAKPNDLWFHARGSSGSHTVLRNDSNAKPPKYILQKAASVAAYYSGAKNAKYVPVAYTYKKYVSKPRGSNPGSVVLAREDVIMVEPKLPDNQTE